MRVDGFYVVGRDTPGEGAMFMHTCVLAIMGCTHTKRLWGDLRFADRYLMFKDAKKAARECESDEPAAVWRVEVTATKEDDGNGN